ncbi:MAG: SPOR domain-containing protein [Betaproteobacteria bacterium]|nr:MAG: SPOR domain-containing protein [Betaproteobacteria bacterium]
MENSTNSPSARPNTAPFLFGGMMGFVAGLVVAGVVAIWIYQSTPFRAESTPPAKLDPIRKPESNKAAATGVAVIAKEESKGDAQRITPPASVIAPSSAPAAAAPAAIAAPKPSVEPSPSAEPRGRLWLQVGAFANPNEAEAQRAKFALLGYEATVIAATVPDKGTVHRVRVGPYKDPDEMGKARGDLARQGIEVSVVKP